ncbi:MAG: OmpH family outer membrane protein [Chlamydiales bacterium]|nr:OmpH family outer membrane protein [Chlamydiales bacterium]
MKNSRFMFSLLAASLVSAGSISAEEAPVIGMVNLANCMSDSKLGKQEQETLQNIQHQMISLMENTDKELKEIDGKLKDTEYLDSLSPQAEAELQAQREQLSKSISQYQNQFYQVLQQAQYQTYQKVLADIATASEEVAKQNNFSYILKEEACFYIRPDLDVTSSVISEMDRRFDLNKTEDQPNETASLRAIEESMLNKAG